MAEITKREIPLEMIDSVLADSEVLNGEKETDCPKCFSNKFYSSVEIDQVEFNGFSSEIKNNYRTCLVCLYSSDKEIYERDKSRTWNIFGLIRFFFRNN